MPKDTEKIDKSDKNARAIPAPVRAALAVLKELGPVRAEKLRKPLPAYAMTLARQGQDVTEDILHQALAKGNETVIRSRVMDRSEKPPETFMERYAKTVRRIKEKILQDDPSLPEFERLKRACFSGNMDVLKKLLPKKHGYAPDKLDILVANAVENGHLDVLPYMASIGVKIFAHDMFDAAVAQNRKDMIDFFLKQGIEPRGGRDVLIVKAIDNGHLDMAKHLEEKGLPTDHVGERSVIISAEKGYMDIARYFIEEKKAPLGYAGTHALRKAAAGGYLEIVKLLDQKDVFLAADSHAALKAAANGGHTEVVEYLLSRGEDANCLGGAALQEAASQGRLEVAKILVKNGADAKNNFSLAVAAAGDHLDVMRFLMSMGSDPAADHSFALRMAADAGKLEAVRFLTENGAEITAKNNEALQDAFDKRHFRVCYYLLQNGASSNNFTKENQKILTEKITGISAWLEKTGKYPLNGFETDRPGLYDPDGFQDLAKMLKMEGYADSDSSKMIRAGIGFFDTAEKVMDYFEKWASKSHQPMHDALYVFRGDRIDIPNKQEWQSAVMQHGPKMARLLKFADKMGPVRSGDGKQWSFTLTQDAAAKFIYSKAEKNPSLAVLFNKYGKDEFEFERALDVVDAKKKLKKKANLVPDIAIDGKSFDMPGTVFKKLPDGDYRGLILGELTGCCQSIGSNGEECAVHGFTSPNGGFYVVAVNDEKRGEEIVGQSWAWRGANGELTLDSLETLGGRVSKQQWTSLINEFSKALQKTDVKALHIGAGGATPRDLPFNDAAEPALPKDYKGYRDSRQQYRVWSRK